MSYKSDTVQWISEMAKAMKTRIPDDKEHLVGKDLENYLKWHSLMVAGMAIQKLSIMQFTEITNRIEALKRDDLQLGRLKDSKQLQLDLIKEP